MTQDNILKKTPLYDAHIQMNARMTAFAGYDMPVSFAGGIAEHNHVRGGGTGIFDVSHMGQIDFTGSHISAELEKILPCDVTNLPAGKCKYSVLLNENGGIIDDLILSKNHDGTVSAVVNGSRKYVVMEHLREYLPETVTVTLHDSKALIALQGASAVQILMAYCPQIAGLKFMEFGTFAVDGFVVTISRSGYTGEDGFEISCLDTSAIGLYNLLLSDERVMPIGLGARDTLRLEAGLCLYGQDLTTDITPIQAGLSWCIHKPNTANHHYIGAEIIAQQMQHGTNMVRVGIIPNGRAIIRSGVELFNDMGDKIGFISSGGFSPTLDMPIAMGYVTPEFKAIGTEIFASLRGKNIPVTIAKMPFVGHKYIR